MRRIVWYNIEKSRMARGVNGKKPWIFKITRERKHRYESRESKPEKGECGMEEEREVKRMQEQRFLDHIYEGYYAGQRYCFVLGAGASKASGIRTGEEMMREWRNDLIKKGASYIDDCARELGLEPGDYQPIFKEDHVLKNDDYFTLFDLRFAGKPNVAYAYLEHEMEEKYPSYGYYPLAMLLSNTQNRLIITTNFDSLIEDALYTYTFKHPLVVGHESLASYIVNDTRHPVVAKIHRDLLFQPLNRKQDMENLKEEWERPLRSALSRYIPIVVGYGGGDRTFMSLLDKIELNGIYWCHLGEPSDEIKRIVREKKGYLVKILGFDEVMFQIGQCFSVEAKFEDPCQYLQDEAKKRCDLYQKSFQEIRSRYEIQKKDASNEQSLSWDVQSDVLRLADAIDRYDSQQSGDAEIEPEVQKLASEALAESINGNWEKAAGLYTQVIALAPNYAEYYKKRSVALYRLGRYEEALQDDTKVIELEPLKAEYYNNRSTTLYAMKRYEEALQDDSKAIELEPSKAEYYYSRGLTLHAMERYAEALQDKTKAIELNPSNSDYYKSRSTTLYVMGRYEETLQDDTKAIELNPSKPDYYNSRGITLHAMKRYAEALRDRTKAIELDPSNSDYYKSRSTTLYAMRRYKETLRDDTRAIELNPSRPDYYDSRSITLRAMRRYEEALQDETKAIELDPSHAQYYRNRAAILRKLNRENEALEDEAKAAGLE